MIARVESTRQPDSVRRAALLLPERAATFAVMALHCCTCLGSKIAGISQGTCSAPQTIQDVHATDTVDRWIR